MLKVTIHAGGLSDVSRFNVVAWLDIGYDRLGPIADYKTVLFQNGNGAMPMAMINKYPRWSASLWDLVARSIALGLRADPDCLKPLVPEVLSTRKRSAFASRVSAVIEHVPVNGLRQRTLATVEIKQAHRRGSYIATFTEDTWGKRVTEPFEFMPDVLRPAELLLRACVTRLNGTQELPPMPTLTVPTPVELNGLLYVPIQKLPEPARTGFSRWLHMNGINLISCASTNQPLAPEKMYGKFLKEAV